MLSISPLTCVVIRPRMMIMEVMMLEASSSFFYFFLSCSCVSGRWWLSDIGSSRGADEEFSLSSLTQGYGSILLSTLFLFHHKLLPLSLYSTSILSPTLLLSLVSPCLGSRPCFFSQFLFVLRVPALCLSLYLPLSGLPHIEASTIRIVLSRAVFSLSHNLHLNETAQKLL